MRKKTPVREYYLEATVLVLLIVAAVLIGTYMQIAGVLEKRSLSRMEEGVNTVIGEITAKLRRDSARLNAVSGMMGVGGELDNESVGENMRIVRDLFETSQVRVLMPDNTIIKSDGTAIDGTGYVDFNLEAPLGEHVSDRMFSAEENNAMVIRQFVPVVQNGETVALVYGVTDLRALPSTLNIGNIYNAKAGVYIIDTASGEYIMDTVHDTLGNVADFSGEIEGDLTWDEVCADILSGGTGQTIYRELGDNEWHYMYYAPSGVNHWTIGVVVPRSEAFIAVEKTQRICIIAALILGAVMILYFLFVRFSARQTMNRAVERAVLEEKLQKAEAAERAKTTFLANMSHDIRTPMNAIIGFTTLAQGSLDNTERVQDYLKKIMASSNHLLSLINDVLDMSRIESGRLEIDEKPCSISDIFRDMRNIILTQMQTKQLNFFMDTIDVADEDIYCDKLHLNQVLLNLLSNAIKFTPNGGSISLSIRQKPGAATGYGAYEIRVKDTGIGMSREFAEHVFEPFERERNSTVSGIQGTGLGMAITKSIIDAMGGTIAVETEEGHGTEFIMELQFRLQSVERQSAEIRELNGLRALVVDDSFDTCDSVTKMLTQIGMRAEWTLHGKEAILRARQAVEMGDSFSAYIIDWVLPDLNGLEVARQIRAEVGEDTPIIILTAYDWTPFEDEARSAGVTAFCNKPIFLSELRDALAASIHREEPEEEPIIPALEPAAQGTRLLLVEDNELNQEIAEELLTRAGFRVECAEDGTVAVSKVKESAPGYYALVLMDIQMPLMNGYDAARAIRGLEDPQLANIPIIAMTANAFEDDRRRALEAGMNDHVAKPINVERLMSVLRRILQEQGDE